MRCKPGYSWGLLSAEIHDLLQAGPELGIKHALLIDLRHIGMQSTLGVIATAYAG